MRLLLSKPPPPTQEEEEEEEVETEGDLLMAAAGGGGGIENRQIRRRRRGLEVVQWRNKMASELDWIVQWETFLEGFGNLKWFTNKERERGV